jgi:phosphatidylinositol alpha-mannosyltransferase
MWPVIKRKLTRLDGCIAVSTPSRDYARRSLPGPYQVIPNGVDIAAFMNPVTRPLPNLEGGKKILFVGRLEPRKGFQYLLEAFALVKITLPDTKLLVVGPYSAKERRSFEIHMRKMSLADVHFVGYVSDEDLPQYYQASDVFCAPSLGSESFGMVLLEAMAAGTPIVASDIAGYRTVVTHEQEGILVPPRDVRALAGALKGLLRDPNLCRTMGRRGQLCAAQYSWEHVADQVLSYYHHVLERKRDCFCSEKKPDQDKRKPFPEKGGRLAYVDRRR